MVPGLFCCARPGSLPLIPAFSILPRRALIATSGRATHKRYWLIGLHWFSDPGSDGSTASSMDAVRRGRSLIGGA